VRTFLHLLEWPEFIIWFFGTKSYRTLESLAYQNLPLPTFSIGRLRWSEGNWDGSQEINLKLLVVRFGISAPLDFACRVTFGKSPSIGIDRSSDIMVRFFIHTDLPDFL